MQTPGRPRNSRFFSRARYSLPLILVLLALAGYLWLQAVPRRSPHLVVTFLAVGQGDCTFLEFPHGGNMLVDGGPQGAGKKVVLPFLRKKGISRIDTVVLTHPHADHVGGLLEVLGSFPVGLVLDSGQVHTSRCYEDFLEQVEQEKIPWKEPRVGEKLTGYRDVEIAVMNPPQSLFLNTGSDLNNNSIVLRIAYGDFRLLLAADMEWQAEKWLVNGETGSNGKALRAEVLKVPHQGAKTSSNWLFLRKVQPEVAVISVGAENPYGHPSSQVIARYEKLGAKILRTDLAGTITITSDGSSYWIQTARDSSFP